MIDYGHAGLGSNLFRATLFLRTRRGCRGPQSLLLRHPEEHSSQKDEDGVIGRRFGRWTVLESAGSVRYARSTAKMWLCKCACGKTKIIPSGNLTGGKSRGCRSCHARDSNITHGKSCTQLYKTWTDMIGRCENTHRKCWPDYGGRGIKVCKRWRNTFLAFLADVGERSSPLHSIDRINNDGNYEPGNVRWATKAQQANNTRTRKRETYCRKNHHELTADNLIVKKNGSRLCLQCQRIWTENRKRKAAAVAACR